MKTPFDTALRIRQREIERVGMAIGVESGQLLAIERAREAATAAAIEEARAASVDPMMSSFAYLSRMRAVRERLEQERAASAERLDRLRDEAKGAYGSRRAMETAADSFRAVEAQAATAAEQSLADDISTAALLRARRATARTRAA